MSAGRGVSRESIVDQLPLPTGVLQQRQEQVALVHANQPLKDWLERLGPALWRELESGARSRPHDVAPWIHYAELDEPKQLLVTWFPDSPAARRVMALERWALTDRQLDVVELVAEGHANRSIALILGISVSTVELHITRVLERLNLDNRSGLVAAWWRTRFGAARPEAPVAERE